MHAAWRFAKAFYWKAYEADLTGLSAMVAYNFLLSIFPLALLGLFIAGRLLESPELQASILRDLRDLFPRATEGTLINALDSVKSSTTGIGVAALVASIWIGSSFWGALDTAFCRIYHFRCRTWLQQKRFGFVMLAVSLLLMAASVALPAIQSALTAGRDSLPFGLAEVTAVAVALSFVAGLALLFAILTVIFWAVPNRLVPWTAIWPGAAAATVAIAAVDWGFPFYLANISTLATVGTTLVFILIVLLWCYVVAIILLGAATINAMRFESRDRRSEADVTEALTPEPEVL